MISRGIPTPEDPQWGCFEQDQAEALAKIGHKVVVLSVDRRFLWKYRRLGCTKVINNGVTYFNSYIMPGKVARCFGCKFADFVKYKQLDYLYKKSEALYGKPDIIYSHFYFNTALGVYLKNKYNIPLVGVEHAGLFNNDDIPFKMKFLGDIAYKSADAVISVSKTLAERMKYHFNRDSFVVYNPIGKDFYINKSINRTDHPFTFISVGSLFKLKGFDLLVPAFLQSNLPKSNWRMFLIGSGEEYDNLQKQIAEAQLQDNIILLGRKTKQEISELLNSSHVFILPSRLENFSVAVLEALACGLPVISSICGGIKECIDSTNGLLFPVDDVDALSECIRTTYNNYSIYDREQISNNCMNRFSSIVIANNLTDIFNTVLNK